MGLKKFIGAAQKQMEGMSKEQKIEHIKTYYWYHILLTSLGIVLLILFIRHVFFVKDETKLTCVMVNLETNYARDGEVERIVSETYGWEEGAFVFDSDYPIYEGDHGEVRTNQSCYEKFFLNWSSGVLDGIILPESFYEYCLSVGCTFEFVAEIPALCMEKLSITQTKETILYAIPNGKNITSDMLAFARWLGVETGEQIYE